VKSEKLVASFRSNYHNKPPTMSTIHSIPLKDAVIMNRTYRAMKEIILDPRFQNQGILPTCETFDSNAILDLLGQPGCSSLRIYYGMDAENKVHGVLVGVDANDNDMLPLKDDEAGVEILEMAKRCPSVCPPSSVLNT
jgi:hypothetical protein